jgi:hypothetical protein
MTGLAHNGNQQGPLAKARRMTKIRRHIMEPIFRRNAIHTLKRTLQLVRATASQPIEGYAGGNPLCCEG